MQFPLAYSLRTLHVWIHNAPSQTLEEGAGGGTIHGANHSEDGSIGGARSHRHSRRTTAATPRTGGISSSRPGSRGGSPRHTSAAGASGGGQQGSRRASRGHNHLPSQPTSVVSVGGGGGGLNTARQAMAVGGGVADGVGRHADLSARGSARGASNGGMLTGGFHSTAGLSWNHPWRGGRELFAYVSLPL